MGTAVHLLEQTIARRRGARPIRVGFTSETLAFRLFYHEVHHRAQVMAMLRQMGIAAQDVDFNRYAFALTELDVEVRALAPKRQCIVGILTFIRRAPVAGTVSVPSRSFRLWQSPRVPEAGPTSYRRTSSHAAAVGSCRHSRE